MMIFLSLSEVIEKIIRNSAAGILAARSGGGCAFIQHAGRPAWRVNDSTAHLMTGLAGHAAGGVQRQYPALEGSSQARFDFTWRASAGSAVRFLCIGDAPRGNGISAPAHRTRRMMFGAAFAGFSSSSGVFVAGHGMPRVGGGDRRVPVTGKLVNSKPAADEWRKLNDMMLNRRAEIIGGRARRLPYIHRSSSSDHAMRRPASFCWFLRKHPVRTLAPGPNACNRQRPGRSLMSSATTRRSILQRMSSTANRSSAAGDDARSCWKSHRRKYSASTAFRRRSLEGQTLRFCCIPASMPAGEERRLAAHPARGNDLEFGLRGRQGLVIGG